MSPLLLVPILLAPPATWRAEGLTVDGDTVTLDRPQLIAPAGTLSAAEARRLAPTAACPGGAWRLTGPIEAQHARGALQATGGAACPGAGWSLTGVHLRAPGLSFAADRLSADAPLILRAEGVEATGCACADPPWRITACAAELTFDAGVWAQWPVLWLGPVPVAVAPAAYLPVGPRRSGLLPPILGYDGQDGLHGRLPLYWAPSDQLDLTLAPGWRQSRGLAARGWLRWAQTHDDGGALEARGLLREGLTVDGAGSATWGPARLGLAGTWSQAEAARQAQFQGLEARARDHLAAGLGLAVAGADSGLGTRLVILQDLRDADRPHGLWAEGWARWQAEARGAKLSLDLSTLDRLDAAAPTPLADLSLRLERPAALGPLALRPQLGVASVTHLREDSGADQALVGWAALGAHAAAEGRLLGLRHRLTLGAEGRLSAAGRGLARPLRPADRPFASRALTARIDNALRAGGAEAGLGLALPWEWGTLDGEAPGRGPLLAEARLQTDPLGLTGAFAGAEAWWAELRWTPLPALSLLAGGARLQPGAAHPWRRSGLLDRPALLSADAPDHLSLTPGLALAAGPVHLDGRLVLDAHPGRARTYRGAFGQLGLQGGCACWSVRLQANHEAGRRAPDLGLHLALTPL